MFIRFTLILLFILPIHFFSPLQEIAENDPVEDYRELVKAYPWEMVLTEHTKYPCHLLDVGCGTGRWPAALQWYTELKWYEGKIIYDCIDLSELAVKNCLKTLYHPLYPGKGLVDYFQNVSLPINKYDFIWSIHSLYAVSSDEIEDIVKKCLSLLRPGGRTWIALATKESFYCTFYKAFQKEYHLGPVEEYTSAEDITKTLDQMNIHFHLYEFEYDETISANDHKKLKHFLLKECVAYSFNRDPGANEETKLRHLFLNPVLKEKIESYRHSDIYHFPQSVWLIEIEKDTNN